MNPTKAQQEVVDILFNHPFWSSSRGAGKSWLRAYITKRLIEEEQEEIGYYKRLMS